MEFFDTIRQVKSNWQPYKKWELEQQKKEEQNKELRAKYPPTAKELEQAKQYGRTIVETINIMDQHSIDKSEDVSLALGYKLLPFDLLLLGLGTVVGNVVAKRIKNPKLETLKPYGGLLGYIAVSATISPLINILQAKLMKQASRVARFQTRENDLKDSRNFVVYTDEQIKEAEEKAKTLPEVKEKRQDMFTSDSFNPYKSYLKAQKTTTELKKDDAKYQEWKNEYLKHEANKKEIFKTLNPSKEEISKAEKDRDKILNTIMKIEKSSLNYLNNMEMASYMIGTVVCFAFMVAGAGITKLFALATKNSKKLQKIKALPLVLSTIAPIFILSPMNKLVKDAARIGRFKAKQELLNNPESFITYDSEQRESTNVSPLSDVEIKREGFIKRFKDDLIAIKNLQKDAKEYGDYMRTKHKEDLKLDVALNQIEISSNQKNEAVELQKKAFHSFEKMDEKAQRFTDDSDAAIDSARSVLNSIMSLSVKILSLYICGKELKRVNNNKVPEGFWKAIKLTFTDGLTPKTMLGLFLPVIIPPFFRTAMVAKGVQLKKEAGKIGIMTAMKDLDDPKNYIDEKDRNQTKGNAQVQKV